MIVVEEKTIMLQRRLLKRGKYTEFIYQCPICDTTILRVVKENVYTINDISISECNHYRVRVAQDTKTTMYFIVQK